jgi:Fe2+ or Zn2+ uptake regulation protein
VFDYLDKLEQAGLISKVDEDGGTAVYTAETAYDLVEALYSIFDLGDDEPGPTTYTG